uniref:Uncharacterized protein n=1 Tax=Angiostrongylus cantonensis TaxID=6313 RepID=C7TNY6_ANGCA|nr:hypothetical protein [Angiostrongylus cantonensis]
MENQEKTESQVLTELLGKTLLQLQLHLPLTFALTVHQLHLVNPDSPDRLGHLDPLANQDRSACHLSAELLGHLESLGPWGKTGYPENLVNLEHQVEPLKQSECPGLPDHLVQMDLLANLENQELPVPQFQDLLDLRETPAVLENLEALANQDHQDPQEVLGVQEAATIALHRALLRDIKLQIELDMLLFSFIIGVVLARQHIVLDFAICTMLKLPLRFG